MALVGESRVTEMLANVFFPLAIAQDETRWIGFKNLRASLTNRRVEIAALRLFGDEPRGREFLKSARSSRACCKSTKTSACATPATARAAFSRGRFAQW